MTEGSRRASARQGRGPVAFRSFMQAGFECSTHRRADGRRLDLVASTGHERHVDADFRRVVTAGMATVRDGVRWHRIESADGRYDWSSWLPMLRAARRHGVEVIWDLCHYGYPDHLDLWKPAFVERFARYAAAAARVALEETGRSGWYCPINEISFWAWAGGDHGQFHPVSHGRGAELKRQLVRASILAIDAIREVDPGARFVQCDPLINVVAPPDGPHDRHEQAYYGHEAQFEAFEMLVGRRDTYLGGDPRYLDVIGANFYSNNQWYVSGETIFHGHPAYRPFRDMLADLHRRYGVPILISETGAEGDARAPWLRYVGTEVDAALRDGIPVSGICLYPIVDYPGWNNDRLCETGLWSGPDDQGARAMDQALGEELAVQRARFEDIAGDFGDFGDFGGMQAAAA